MIAVHAAVLSLLSAGAAGVPLLSLEGPLVVEFVQDPETRALCGGRGVLRLSLAEPATLTLALDGSVLAASVDAGPVASVQTVPLSAGPHELVLELPAWPGAPERTLTYQIEARSQTGAARQLVSGNVWGDLVNPTVLPIGHTFVKGVDLLDGHLVQQSTDIKIPGRHLELELTRTYSSASRRMRGLAGAGWTASLLGGLFARPTCGLYAVVTADGSAQTFQSTDGRHFTRHRGYHTSLARDPDGVFVFQDKAGLRYRYARTADAWGRHRLLHTEEPHGDRLELRYDARGRAVEVAEVQKGLGGVRLIPRVLHLEYLRAGGFDRLSMVEAVSLGLRVEFSYDEWGNLTRAVRRDDELPRVAEETGAYSVRDPRDRHQLETFVGEDGVRREYRYQGERVVRIEETSAKGEKEVTALSYPRVDGDPAEVFRAVVGSGAMAARYRMNADGFPVEIDDADGTLGRRKIWRSTWDRWEKVKTGQTNSRGYLAVYAYDDRGNLVSETTTEEGATRPRVASYAYDPRFNKLVYRRDAQGRVSTWAIDPRTGDLLSAKVAGKPPAVYEYDAEGRLIDERDGEGRCTRYLDHDSFGNSTRIIHPDGKVERREYDLRGRSVKLTPDQ